MRHCSSKDAKEGKAVKAPSNLVGVVYVVVCLQGRQPRGLS